MARLFLLTIAFLWLCTPVASHAAEFRKTMSANGRPDVIFVVGDFNLGDERKFIHTAIDSENAMVVFQSPGGSSLAGIEIGAAIHLKGFATFVPDGVQCASACALAWLGGRVRYMSNTSQVGFHAAYVENGGRAAVSSAGNALVGAYLSQLNLAASAIVYITEAPPEGMQWLSFADAQRYGIDVRPLDLSAVLPHQVSTPKTSVSTQISAVRREVYEFFSETNRTNDASLSYLDGKYSEQVDYYGKLLSRQAVLDKKRVFFEKWPVRNYSVRSNSVGVSCSTTSECKVEGILDWEASGGILNSKGSASFSLLWIEEDGVWKISSESTRSID